MDAAMDHIEKKKKKKKIRGNMSDERIKEENGVEEVFGTQESSNHGNVGAKKKETKKNKDLNGNVEGGRKETKKNTDLNTVNRSGKELKEENSLGRFIDVWGTQNSGSHEGLERGEKKKKKKKNEDLMAENSLGKESENSESHEKAQRQERRRKKKNRDLKSECFDGSEFDQSFVAKEENRSTEGMSKKSSDFVEEVIEGKPVKNDSFNDGLGKERSSEKAKKKKKHRIVEVEREEKMNHIVEGDVEVEFEKTPEKKRRKTTDGGEEIEAELGEKMSNKISTEEKMAEEEGSKLVNTEGENPEGSAKAKSKEKMKKKKEKMKKKRKERETIPNDAVDREDVSPSAKKQKKVTFSNQVEVCGADESNDKETCVDSKNAAGIPDTSNGEDNLIRGKRFTLEEDKKILDAIDKYIQDYGLDKDEGFNMILNCQKYSKVRKCWKEIASALPWRPLLSIYDRAHILCERSEERRWTKDEEDMLKRLQAEHGKKWNKIAKVLGKSRYHVKDKWRRMRRGVMNKGHMSQEEYQKLFDLVNYNLRLKLSGKEQRHTHNKIRKNINWEAIADKMETRDHVFCCKKWYGSLTSPMVESGQWQDGDDFILLKRLLESNASDEEVVDWDDLLKDRPGDICHKRWKQMVKQLGEHRSKSFLKKLELLVGRYAPELIE